MLILFPWRGVWGEPSMDSTFPTGMLPSATKFSYKVTHTCSLQFFSSHSLFNPFQSWSVSCPKGRPWQGHQQPSRCYSQFILSHHIWSTKSIEHCWSLSSPCNTFFMQCSFSLSSAGSFLLPMRKTDQAQLLVLQLNSLLSTVYQHTPLLTFSESNTGNIQKLVRLLPTRAR